MVCFTRLSASANGRTFPVKPIDPEDSVLENWRPGVQTRMLMSAQNGADQLCIFEQWVAPDTGAPAHSHPVEEVLTVLAGGDQGWVEEARARGGGRGPAGAT